VGSVEILFAAFGLASQALLVGFFAARRWSPDRARPLGIAGYAVAGLGLPLSIALQLLAAPGTLVVGPLLMAAWALFGALVDVWRPIPWRGPPAQWGVLGLYVALYLMAQMWLWWPLWDLNRAAWLAFLVLFVINTGLNIAGHVGIGSRRAR
jgi:hypothetical protein